MIECVFEFRIRGNVKIDTMQFGFMLGKGTTDTRSSFFTVSPSSVSLKVTRTICVTSLIGVFDTLLF